ncbi:hypothetical protein CMK11_07000 [Candidatus Poribacteria bacterium]|nr:hypothetical protein [Candidatus Poribacteria bacterium]
MPGDIYVLVAAILALCGVIPGNAWAPALAAAGAGVSLRRAMRQRMSSEERRAVLGGIVAGAVVATGDWGFVEARFLFHMRTEAPFVPVSVGVEACRGALFAALLYAYVRLRASWSVVVSALAAALLAACVGLAFEHVGTRAGLWDWNASLMPDRQVGSAWAFVPVAWGLSGVCFWYFLMGFSRRVPLAFHPVGVGIRFGAAYLGLTMISYALLLRLYGKVVMQ